MENVIMSLLKFLCRLLFAYGLCLLFTAEFNPLIWSDFYKVCLVILCILLLSQD